MTEAVLMSEQLITAATPPPLKIIVRRSRADGLYRKIAWTAAASTFVILVLIGIFLYLRARPAFSYMGY